MTTGSEQGESAVLRPVGDCALLVEFENRIDEATNERVITLASRLENSSIRGIGEAVISYRALLLHYDPVIVGFDALCAIIKPLLQAINGPLRQHKRWTVPVHYGGAAGLDLERLAQLHQLSEERLIDIHSNTVYRVYMVGFAPGWTFLGGLDPRLHTPRLQTPRTIVPAGCISIGGQQTLIGGQAMPSGWNLIGQTPERSFAPERAHPFFMSAGDEVSLRRICRNEFDDLSQLAATGVRVSQELK